MLLRTIGRRAKAAWMAFAHAVGWINTRILLTVVYVLLIGPPALVLKLLRRDLLDRRLRDRESYWRERPEETPTLDRGRHQF